MYESILLAVTCPALSNPSNGKASYSKSPVNGRYPMGTVGSFTCNDGCTREGSSSRTCQTSQNWSNKLPTCKTSNEINLLTC